MPQNIRPFLLGVICAMLVAVVILFGMDHFTLGAKQNSSPGNQQVPSTIETPARSPIQPEAVRIYPLPPIHILTNKVEFEGKKEMILKLNGSYAKNIVIVSFVAGGTNAYKSQIKIVWDDGTSQVLPAGASNIILPPDKKAKQIIVSGYSIFERKIFKDSSWPGTLEWDIRYESVYN